MAYIQTEWATGDVITAEKLNNAERGIAAASPVFIPVTYDETTHTNVLGASYNELKALMGKQVIGIEEYTEDPYLCRYFYFVELRDEVDAEDSEYKAYFYHPTMSGGQYIPAIATFSATDPDENMK